MAFPLLFSRLSKIKWAHSLCSFNAWCFFIAPHSCAHDRDAWRSIIGVIVLNIALKSIEYLE